MRKSDGNASGQGDDSRRLPVGGQPGALLVSEGERKVVTVLFADVVSSLSYSQQFDDEQFRDLLDSALAVMVKAVQEFGGSVIRLQGDGVLALFGAPKAQEDHAVRACLAALQLRNAFAGGVSSSDAVERLKIRIGLHTGEAITRSLSTGLSHDYDAVGKAVHIGARTEQLCPPGSILVTGDVVALTCGLFEFREIGAQRIRGTDEPYRLFELMAKAPDRIAAGLLPQEASPFLDRESILDTFATMLANPDPSRPAVLRLEGDAGYGKSRLVLELAGRARRAGFTVVATTGVSHFSDVPYLGIRTLILQLLRLADREYADDLETSLERAFDRVEAHAAVDRIALLDILGIVRKDQTWEALNPPERRARLHEAPVALWRAIMDQNACLLVVEDLHWMDQASIEVLCRVIATKHVGPFLAIATHRATKRELPQVIANVPASLLEPLSSADTYCLIALVSADPHMPGAVRETIARRSAGVPFYVCELVRGYHTRHSSKESLHAGSDHPSGAEREYSEIPLAIEASILARFDQLPDAARRIAHTGAVIGAICDVGILERASQMPRADFEPAIAQLVDAGLLVRAGESESEQVAFHHEIARDVLLRTIVSSRRRGIHRALLRAMEEAWGQDANDTRQIHSLALHAEAAEQWIEGLVYLTRACRRAVRNSSVEEAVRLYDRARRAISKIRERDCRAQELDLHLLVFGAYLTLGEIERMNETLTAAADIARSLGDERRLALATAQLATAQWMGGDHVAAARSAHFALNLAKQTSSLPLQISAEFALANALHGQGHLVEAIAGHQRIIESLDRLGLEDQRLGWAGLPSVMSRAFLSWFLIELGRFDDARKQIDRGCAVADAARQPYSQVLIHAGESLYYLRRRYPEHALPILEPTLKLCQTEGVHTMEAHVVGWLGSALVAHGHAREALAVTEDAFRRDMHRRGGKSSWFYLFKAIGEAHAALGNTEEALAWTDSAIQVTREANEVLHFAQGLKSRGDTRLLLSLSPEAATNDLTQARAIGEQHGLAPLVAECDLSLARACRRLHRDQEARRFACCAAQAFRRLRLERHLAEAESLAA